MKEKTVTCETKKARIKMKGYEMTIAKYFINRFNRIETDENGFLDYDFLKQFRKSLYKYSIDIFDDNEYGSYSYDSSLTFTFKDGSKLYLANPKQEAFFAFCYEK